MQGCKDWRVCVEWEFLCTSGAAKAADGGFWDRPLAATQRIISARGCTKCNPNPTTLGWGLGT